MLDLCDLLRWMLIEWMDHQTMFLVITSLLMSLLPGQMIRSSPMMMTEVTRQHPVACSTILSLAFSLFWAYFNSDWCTTCKHQLQWIYGKLNEMWSDLFCSLEHGCVKCWINLVCRGFQNLLWVWVAPTCRFKHMLSVTNPACSVPWCAKLVLHNQCRVNCQKLERIQSCKTTGNLDLQRKASPPPTVARHSVLLDSTDGTCMTICVRSASYSSPKWQMCEPAPTKHWYALTSGWINAWNWKQTVRRAFATSTDWWWHIGTYQTITPSISSFKVWYDLAKRRCIYRIYAGRLGLINLSICNSKT